MDYPAAGVVVILGRTGITPPEPPHPTFVPVPLPGVEVTVPLLALVVSKSAFAPVIIHSVTGRYLFVSVAV